MLSLQVATERADLARVERQIIATKQQIRSLQTELGTRGRLAQLEQWNADVLALSAPASGQFLQDEFTLARLETDDSSAAEHAPVRMAALKSAEARQPPPRLRPGPRPQSPRPASSRRRLGPSWSTAPATRAARRSRRQTAAPKSARSATAQSLAEPKPVKAKRRLRPARQRH